MPAIVEFPQVIGEALEQFGDIFPNRPQRDHFAEYVTGLIVARKKNVSGINAEFVDTTDQSCLNRFLTSADWDVEQLNAARLDLMQEDSSTRYGPRGVIPIDNVLIDHDGQLIEDVGWFWDHAQDRPKIAHDYLFANYVCASGKHYPLEFRRFKKRDQCQANQEKFQDHGVLFRELVDWVCDREIPGTFTFDCFFSGVQNLNHIHAQKNEQGESRAYVADLKINRRLEVRGKSIRVDELAASIPRQNRRELRRGDKRQWFYTTTVRLPQVRHPVRIVLIWRNRRDREPAKVLISNRTRWEINRILKTYRYRWTGTETFHRDGKQELGMGACQLRSGQGQTRHMHLVMLAYTILMRTIKSRHAKSWALQRLTTIGQACRAVTSETLATTLRWAMTEITQNSNNPRDVLARLGLT